MRPSRIETPRWFIAALYVGAGFGLVMAVRAVVDAAHLEQLNRMTGDLLKLQADLAASIIEHGGDG